MLYGFIWTFVRVVGTLFFRARCYGEENIPRTGPLIVACNHLSFFDPPILGGYFPRRVSYMAKKELFDIPLLGPTIAHLGAYPVDRQGSAMAAIKRSVQELRAQRCVGIFPEGGRNPDGAHEARAGVALLASLAKAPVVPAAIVGTRKLRFFHPIKVAFGPPMSLPADRKATRDDLEKFTEEVMRAIGALAESNGGNS